VKNFKIENVHGRFAVVKTHSFLWFKSERFLNVGIYRHAEPFLWFVYGSPDFFTMENHTFGDLSDAEKALWSCNRFLK
jgi:hypothetical protein